MEREKEIGTKNCVKCGILITKGLRCSKCRERVDEEFRGEISRPLHYYFKWNLRHKK